MSGEQTNDKLLREIHKTVIELETRQKNLLANQENLLKVFKPNGVCDRSRRQLGNLATYIKIQWGLIVAIASALIAALVKNIFAG